MTNTMMLSATGHQRLNDNKQEINMKELILVKYGEMALKGLNKKTFEDMLIKNIKRRLKPLGHFQYTSAQSTT